MAREILRFETNVPVKVALAYEEGKLVDGRFGDQWMYTLADERVMYAAPIVAERIQKLGVRKGEPFTICKREVKDGLKKRIEWQVARPGAEELRSQGAKKAPDPIAAGTKLGEQLWDSLPMAAQAAAGPRPVARPDAAVAARARLGGTHNTGQDSTCPTPAAPRKRQILEAALRAAVDAAVETESYAKERNYPLHFDAEQVWKMAATLFIQAKEGGARWAA